MSDYFFSDCSTSDSDDDHLEMIMNAQNFDPKNLPNLCEDPPSDLEEDDGSIVPEVKEKSHNYGIRQIRMLPSLRRERKRNAEMTEKRAEELSRELSSGIRRTVIVDLEVEKIMNDFFSITKSQEGPVEKCVVAPLAEEPSSAIDPPLENYLRACHASRIPTSLSEWQDNFRSWRLVGESRRPYRLFYERWRSLFGSQSLHRGSSSFSDNLLTFRLLSGKMRLSTAELLPRRLNSLFDIIVSFCSNRPLITNGWPSSEVCSGKMVFFSDGKTEDSENGLIISRCDHDNIFFSDGVTRFFSRFTRISLRSLINMEIDWCIHKDIMK